MTATPIPRTLSLTLYGDLEVSLIDELPPGRKPVETTVVDPAERLGAYEEVQARARRRAAGLRDLPARRGVGGARGRARRRGALRGACETRSSPRGVVGLLHGRMKAPGQARGHGRFPGGGDRGARRYRRRRGRRRRAERERDRDRRLRALRPLPAPPAKGTRVPGHSSRRSVSS